MVLQHKVKRAPQSSDLTLLTFVELHEELPGIKFIRVVVRVIEKRVLKMVEEMLSWTDFINIFIGNM